LFYDGTDQEFIELVRTTEVSPELQRFMYDSPLADMMAVLLNSSDIWLYSDEWFVKGPNGGRTPWHQDLPYWPMEGSKIASAWISLDTLPASECLEYVRGTHHGVRYDGFNPRRVSEDPTLPYLEASIRRCPTLKLTAVHGTLSRGTSHLVTLFWLTLRCCMAVAPPAPTAVVVQSPFACTATTLFMHRGLLASQQFHSHPGCRFN
jgi:hypothetical protein